MFRPAPAFRKASSSSATQFLFWITLVLVWVSPIASFGEWSVVVAFGGLVAVLSFGKPQLSMPVMVFAFYALTAMLLRLYDFAYDETWSLPPVGFGKELSNDGRVTVYVATRDMPEYAQAIQSMESSSGVKDNSSSFVEVTGQVGRSSRIIKLLDSLQGSATQAGLPQLDFVVLDVGSEHPLKEESVGKARVERITATGDSGIPVFHAWEHIARTATSEQVIFFDEDILVPKTFDWNLYSQGAWFFKKKFRDYSACWSAPRTSVVHMVARLRATPHLYAASMRWGGQEDKLAMLAMNLQKAPDVLEYFKLGTTRSFQDEVMRLAWQDTTRVFDRYMLEWNRQGEPSAGYTDNVRGPLSIWSTRIALRGYGIWSFLDLLLLLEMELVPPSGIIKAWLRYAVDGVFYCEKSFPASMRSWRERWISEDMLINVFVDGGSAVFVLATFVSVSLGALGLGKRCGLRSYQKREGEVDDPKECDPLLA